MGRIQRKKTSQKIKKKKNTEAGPAPQTERETAADQAMVAVTPDKEAAKKQIAAQKKTTSAVKASPGKLEKNLLEKSLQFLREVKVELKKVTWPTRKQTMGSTLVVIILVMIISLFLGVVDVGLSTLVRVVFQ